MAYLHTSTYFDIIHFSFGLASFLHIATGHLEYVIFYELKLLNHTMVFLLNYLSSFNPKSIFQQAAGALSELRPSSCLENKLLLFNNSLVQHRLLNHRDKDVRLLIGFCFIQVMRVVAPNPPYSDDDLKVLHYWQKCSPLIYLCLF